MTTVGYFQFNPIFGETEANLRTIIIALRSTNANIVVLPELPFTGYNFKDRTELTSLAEDPTKSEAIEELVDICKKKRIFIVTGFAEKDGDKIYNSSLLLGHKGILHTYRKLHLFNREKEYFDPGNLPLYVTKAGGIKVGMMVCFDWIFPEVARSLALQGAELICHPSNLVLNLCQQTMIGRAIENRVYIVTSNRCGSEKRPHGEIVFTGQSQIVSPKGEVIHSGPGKGNELYVAQFSEQLAREKNITPLNNIMEDRRPEFYSTLLMNNKTETQ